jgi:hypothetical protein
MRHTSKWMFAVSLFAGCTLICLPALGQKNPSPSQVVVVNGTSSPVPVAAQGTTSVAGTVNVGNTPTVSLAGGASVNVTNPLDGQSNPTPLAVLDAIQPYEDSCLMHFSGAPFASCTFQPIPSGKRLVIQEFDARANIETGLKPTQLLFYTWGPAVNHSFTATFMGGDGVIDFFATHQETRLYVAPSQTPACVVHLTGNSVQSYTCTFSGFLVDVP